MSGVVLLAPKGEVSSPYVPGREAAGEGTVKAFAAALVSHFLLPDRHEGAVVTGFWVVWWQRSAYPHVREVGLEGGAGPLGGHGGCVLQER